ncbi:MAG: hypothetical protein ACOYJI_03880 [Anaerovoracaceae bacterium]
MDKKSVSKYNQSQDIWFGGEHLEGPNGGACYFICQYFDKMHLAEGSRTFTKWCKFYDRAEDGSNCNMDCPQFGKCETCGGFSAVRCSDCDILRPE